VYCLKAFNINISFVNTFSFKQFIKVRSFITLGSSNGVTKHNDIDLGRFGTKEVDVVY